MDGLIIKEKWINKILDKIIPKTLEVRGHKTSKQDIPFYILESGTRKVRGIATISCCIPVNAENWEKLSKVHQVGISYKKLLMIYKNPYFWALKDIEIWEDNSTYSHPKGAVIWVKDVEPSDEMSDNEYLRSGY